MTDPIISLGEVVADRPTHRDYPGDAIRVIREAVRTGWLRPVKAKRLGLWFRRSDVDRLWALPTMIYKRQTACWLMRWLRDEWHWRVATIAALFGCSVREAQRQILWVRRARLHMGATS